MIKKCSGCGLPLQYTDESKLGYAPKKDAKICQRCFKLKNYNKQVYTELKYSNEEIIDLINKNADNVYFVTDFLNLSENVINVFRKINKNKTLVINKSDFIPNSIKKEKYLNWVKDIYNINDDLILISATKKRGLNELNNKIINSKNCYICGFTNSGKSTVINSLSEIHNKKSNIISSLMPNTTLDVIKVKLDDNVYIYDTPGFVTSEIFNADLYPSKFIKPITIQTKPDDIISINDTLYIKTDNVANSFTFYMSDRMNIKKVYNKSIKFVKKITIEENNDLFISNYGFINIKNKCEIMINNIDNCVEVRKSMF